MGPAHTESIAMPEETASCHLDGIAKQTALDAELEWTRVELSLETLETRGRDALDFHEISVQAIGNLVRHAFETGFRDGLHAGYRQGRTDAMHESQGDVAPTQPRNPELTP
jgi:hypothetical protein